MIATKTAAKKMTEADYKGLRTHISEQTEARQELASAYCDQELAKLFAKAKKAGWTQEELARQENKSRTWVVYHLCFGDFLIWLVLANVTSGDIPNKPTKDMTERKFRAYWEETSGTKDTARFHRVWKMMLENRRDVSPREDARGIITKKCDPDEWYTNQEIQDLTGLIEKQVRNATLRMAGLGLCEAKNTASGPAYQIRKGEGRATIDTAWLKSLRKAADALIRSIIKNSTGENARYSANGVAIDAGRLKDLMNELKKRITPGSA